MTEPLHGPKVTLPTAQLPVPTSASPPSLWPLPVTAYPMFATHGNHQFGWRDSGFEIVRFNIAWTKVVRRAPRTEDGWNELWLVMVSEYPQLADAVNAQFEQRKGAWLAQVDNHAIRDELKSLGTLTTLNDCVLLGGYGYDETFLAGAQCNLYFTSEGLWITAGRAWTPRIRSPYSEAKAVEFSGPGRVTKGGGFIGGGFGLKGAAEGMIVALS
jgi:hypothetical protein